MKNSDANPNRRSYTADAIDTIVPEPDYVFPILQALVDAGGRSGPQQVRSAVYPKIAHRLSEWDRGDESDKRAIRTRWEHRVDTVRRKLCIAGLMRRDSPVGVWEISDQGREHLEAGDPQATWQLVSQAFSDYRRRKHPGARS